MFLTPNERFRVLFNHRKFFIHGIVIAALTAVAIWDAYTIITDYVTENRFTLVKLEAVNGTFPFLQNEILQLTIQYEPFLHQLWTINSDKMPA